ncbi:hypothetical protein Tco_0710218 [Tanacetum coccineum]
MATRSQDDDKRLCLVDDLKEVQVHLQVKPITTSSSLKSKITTSCSQDKVMKTSRRYFDGHVDIFDMVDVDLFTIVALNMMFIQLGYIGESSLDEGLYALSYSYRRPPPWVRATIEDITDELGSTAVIEHRFEKIFDDLGLNLNEHVDLNVSQIKTQYELPVSKEPDVGRTRELIMEEVMVEDYVSSREDGEHDVPFDNIGVTNLVPNDVLEGEDVDVINAVSFNSDPGNDNETSNYRRKRLVELSREMEGVINASGQRKYLFYTGHKFTTVKEAKDRVYLHSIKSRRNLKLYKNDSVRVRTRHDGKVLVFTMSQGTGPTGPNHGMEVGPSGSSGLTTRKEKRKNTCTNNDSQACSSALDAHDKGDLYPWVLYVRKDKSIKNWMVRTHRDTHKCLQSREIKQCTYKFLSNKIFDQVRVNPEIPVKAVQNQLQHDLELQISMSKDFRAKPKTEREIRGDRVLQYSMLRDYVVELQSTNPNTTVKIAVERNIGPSLPTRVFQRIYGPFPGQVLAAVGLDLNNGIYPLAYPLVEAKSKSSWCWFLQCLGDDIDMNPNLNFTSVIDKSVSFQPLRPRLSRLQSYPESFLSLQDQNHKIESRSKTYSYKVEPINGTNYWEKFTCPTTLLPPKHHVRVGKPKKTRKRSKRDDEPFVKDGKLNKKGRIITCQSCENIGHNKATCKGQEASGSASRQTQQVELVVGQDGSGGSGVGAGIGLSVADCAGGACVGIGSQGSSYTRWTKRRVQTDDMGWYTDEMREQAEKIADDLRDIAYYIVKKVVKKIYR